MATAPLVSELSVSLAHAARLIQVRLRQLEEQLLNGDEAAWGSYAELLRLALDLEARLAPGGHGELLTTAELAARLGVTPKTVLRRKKARELTPALAVGKLIRWKSP